MSEVQEGIVRPTGEMRWLKTYRDIRFEAVTVLQQKFTIWTKQGSVIEWRDVPTVTE